jgi:hypothetical protein
MPMNDSRAPRRSLFLRSPERRVASVVVLALSLAGLAVTRQARAADAEEPIRVSYQAPPSCPDVLAFFLQVRARTHHVRLAEMGENGTPVAVAIQSTDAGSVGTLQVAFPTGEPFVRRVEAPTCDGVAVALSLVLALTFDPAARTSFAAPQAAAGAPDASAPAAPSGSSNPPSGPPPIAPPPPICPVPTAPAPTSRTFPEHDCDDRAAGRPKKNRERAVFGVGGLLMSGMGPSVRAVLSPFVEYGVSEGWWTPSVALSLTWSPTEEIRAPSGRHVDLAFLGGRAMTCPVTAELPASFALSPCAGIDVARLHGEGDADVAGARGEGRFWVAPFLAGRVREEIDHRLLIDVVAGVGLPLSHEPFALVGPSETVFTVPSVTGMVGLFAGVPFP